MAKNRLDFKANLSRHSHDVSAGYSASLAPGMIIPQYFDILGPGDSVYYRTHMFARMQDLITAFLGEVDLHIDYFFVPLQMIYTPFGQVFAQTDDFISGVFSGMSGKDTFPLIQGNSIDVTQPTMADGYNSFECEGKALMRMFDAFDMNPLEVVNIGNAPSGYTPTGTEIDTQLCENPPVAPWIPCAYQAIYQKYFRNDELEVLRVADYNVDSYYNSTTPASDLKYFYLHYCQRPSDYFTKTRVSPIASAVNKLGNSGLQFPADGGALDVTLEKVDSFLNPVGNILKYQKFGSAPTSLGENQAFTRVSTSLLSQPTQYITDPATILNTANIRALFAVDKFSRIYGRADKTYDDQILAHFGIEIPHDVKHDLTHLKHYRAVLQSDPIYGTANVDNNAGNPLSTIGQVGGQGQVTLDTDQEKFTAPVHGVFMAVAYVVTKPRYTSTFSKLHLTTERLRFPIPEFDKLGAQPLYAFEFNPIHLQTSERANRVGWQNRYAEFKEKYDRASLIYKWPDNSHNPAGTTNVFGAYVIARNVFGADGYTHFPTATSAFVKAQMFFENPHALDTVMARTYQHAWNNAYFTTPWIAMQSDPILTEFKCFCKKVSWMSETGEPDL